MCASEESNIEGVKGDPWPSAPILIVSAVRAGQTLFFCGNEGWRAAHTLRDLAYSLSRVAGFDVVLAIWPAV